jgi:hypothetical protein
MSTLDETIIAGIIRLTAIKPNQIFLLPLIMLYEKEYL